MVKKRLGLKMMLQRFVAAPPPPHLPLLLLVPSVPASLLCAGAAGLAGSQQVRLAVTATV